MWKLSEFAAFAQNLVLNITPALKSLLKLSGRAHPSLQAMLVDLMQYRPKLLVQTDRVAPLTLGMEAPPVGPTVPEDPEGYKELFTDMWEAATALHNPLHLPPKARFQKGDAIHVQFDGGSQEGHGTGGFVILNQHGTEIVRVGRYYGAGRTNNEAEAFAMRDAVQCLAKLRRTRPELELPVRVFGDSQLMICFITRLYKRPTRHTIYWALEETRRADASLKQPVAYRHVTRDANSVADDMARRALEAQGDIVFWGG